MLTGAAAELARYPGALEPELPVVLPGEPDSTEDLKRGGGNRPGGVGRARLGHVRGLGQRFGLGVGAPCRVIGERARLLDVVEHLGAAVGDCLVGADRAAELLALA